MLKKLKVSGHLFIVLVGMRYWDLVYSYTVFLPICWWTNIHFVNIRGWPLERYHGNFLHKSIWVSHHFDFWVVCNNICLKMTTPSNIATVQHWCQVFKIWHRYCSCYGEGVDEYDFSTVRKCQLTSQLKACNKCCLPVHVHYNADRHESVEELRGNHHAKRHHSR